MSRPTDLVPASPRPDTNRPDDVSAIVGDAILGSADVARARERRRMKRVRRLVAFAALFMGWVVIRALSGRSILPSLHLPHGLGTALPILLIVVMLGAVMAAPFLGAGRSPHTLVRPGETAVGLHDLVGIDPIKAEVVRSINLFLAHKTFRDAMGGSARQGVLFEGPPGTGKTFVAKAMAKEANVPFLFVSASAFQSMYYGQTNRKIRSFFKQLRKHAHKEGGAIGFIEEIDAIGASRRGLGGSGGTEGVTGVVNELLVQLQSFDTPSRGQRFAWAWIDLLNRYLPDGSQAAQARGRAGQRARGRCDQPQGRPRPGTDPPRPLRPHASTSACPAARRGRTSSPTTWARRRTRRTSTSTAPWTPWPA